MQTSVASPLLRMKRISKSFPGVQALSEIDIQVDSGETLAIVGENGAGKSTLIKTLGGVHQPNSGTIEFDGNPVVLSDPIRAQASGIAIIYQEFNLVPALTVRENIFLGRAIQTGQIINRTAERQRTVELLERLGVAIHPESLVSRLSIAEQQLVEIAKALHTDAKLIVMDEPTAALSPPEVKKLLSTVRELKAHGIGIIYISHRLEEVLEIADRVVVLRDGKLVTEQPIDQCSREKLIEWMVGRSIENEYPKIQHQKGHVRLSVNSLCWSKRIHDINLELRAGEVLGITGLVGSGRTELLRLLSGAESPDSGTIELDGRQVRFNSPRDAIQSGIALLTEDRKGQGLILMHAAKENFGLPNLTEFSRAGWLKSKTESTRLSHFTDALSIKIASSRQLAGQLSGGNQQKLVLAKWLQRECSILLIDEPTRGIDVGAKYEIYLLINELAKSGKSIVMVSSEISEILGMSDRVLVMREGRIAGEITEPQSATQEQIMELAAL